MEIQSGKQEIDGITLDSWAVLAWLQGEKAGIFVKNLIAWCNGSASAAKEITPLLGQINKPPRIYLNLINLGEIFYIIGRKQGEREAKELINRLSLSTLEFVPVDYDLVIRAARLKIKYPIAYADAFAVATAVVTESALLTGDPELQDIADVKIIWLG
ncbi:MAG: hypothetical protein PWQ18_506 [Clostridia bacterium]|nr:hypothetical protein [Clostridia bacterium]